MSVSFLHQLLQAMAQQKGSDLHLATLTQPMYRVRGDVIKIRPDLPVMTNEIIGQMLKEIMTPETAAEFEKNKMADFAYTAKGIGIYRVNAFVQRHGLALVMRALSEKPPTLEQLKTPGICETACSYANGLILVCGPTGSGKSTTLAAMLNFINETTPGHILTLEDPIEFQHESKKCIVNQRSLGNHFTSFASALKAALREDPDVILVGEMRDPETIGLALKAAETGHLVFSTLHTNSASKTVDRIINSFPAEEQAQVRTVLSETLKVVIAQKLIQTADGKGRMCFHDILVNNAAVASLIREGKTFQIPTVMQTGRKEGMQMLDKTLQEAVQAGLVSGETAWEAANEKSMFAQWAPKPPVDHRQVGGTPAQSPAPGMQRPAGVPGSPGSPQGQGQQQPPAPTGVPGIKPIVRKVG